MMNYMETYMNKRRIVLHTISATALASAVGVARFACAAVQKIDLKDPQAVSLGYTDDTTKVDQKKFAKHTKTQTCSNCQFYQAAQEEDGIAPCAVLSNKGVSAKGWCSAWVKKAG
jgi:hypothetical protein